MKVYTLQNGHTLRYHDFPGSGTPIIFIHGLGCASTFDYPEVAVSKELCSHRRILLDLIGYGYSDKPIDYDYSMENHVLSIIELLQHLKIKNIHVFGHSMGGAIAIMLCAKIKQHVTSLTISEGNLDKGGGFLSKEIAGYSKQEYLHQGHAKILKNNIQQKNKDWAMTFMISEPNAIYQGASDLVLGYTPSWREILYSFTFPKAFIFGSQSLPDPDKEKLEQNNVAVLIVKNAGHNMAMQNSHGLAMAMYEIISRSE